MLERKTEVVNLRMSPRVKALLRIAATRERRTLSNMLEVLIENYWQERGLDPETEVEVGEQALTTPVDRRRRARRKVLDTLES